MLSIGACAVDKPDATFECILQPISDRADPKALEVSGLSLETLASTGLAPAVAMEQFERWATKLAGDAGDLGFRRL